MEPPPSKKKRSQCAADALLAAPSMDALLDAKRKKKAASAKAASLNPYNGTSTNTNTSKRPPALASSQLGRSVAVARRKSAGVPLPAKSGITTTARKGTASTAAAAAATAAGGTKTKRPFQTVRGKNDSIGIGIASAFDRRNSRDRISKRPAPQTATDLSLLAMLDVDNGRKAKARRKSNGISNSTNQGVNEKPHLLSSVSQQRIIKKQQQPSATFTARPAMNQYNNNNNKRQTTFTNDSDSSEEEEIVILPPPPSSRSYPTTTTASTTQSKSKSKQNKKSTNQKQQQQQQQASKPRKRISTHHTSTTKLQTDWRGRDKSVTREGESLGKELDSMIQNCTSNISSSSNISNDVRDGVPGSNNVGSSAPLIKTAENNNAASMSIHRAPIMMGDCNAYAGKGTEYNGSFKEGASTLVMSDPNKKGGVSSSLSSTVRNPYQKKDTTFNNAAGSITTKDTTPPPTTTKNDKVVDLEDDMPMPREDDSMPLPLMGIGSVKANNTTNKRGGAKSRRGGTFARPKQPNIRDKVVEAHNSVKDSLEGALMDTTTNEVAQDTIIVSNKQQQPPPGDEAANKVVNSVTAASSSRPTSYNEHNDNNDPTFQDMLDQHDEEESEEKQQLSEWYDAEEQAHMDEEIAAQKRASKEEEEGDLTLYGNNKSRGSRKSKKKSSVDVNENFVRLDLRNSAGACRGARNLKKVNKAKMWRAQHRFGMSDPDPNNGAGDGEQQQQQHGGAGRGGGGSDSRYGNKSRGRGSGRDAGGDLKCFASAKNAGVDPLDDFMDGVFSKSGNGGGEGSMNGGDSAKGGGGGTNKAAAARANSNSTRGTTPRASEQDGGVPMCTRHQRPCKLLTVKRNNKGNKGRKFYVCSLPRGEQCDFFKWEEDTVEATQQALLKSSTNTGFIARQVAAAKTRFKELTVPELRVEAKKRGLKPSDKKDQIVTRLLIWVRDEIADSVEPDDDMEDEPSAKSKTIDLADMESDADSDEEDCIDESDKEQDEDPKSEVKSADSAKEKMIELSDDEESSFGDESSDDDSSSDELEICHEESHSTKKPEPKKLSSTDSSLHDSLERYFGYTSFRAGQEWAIRRTFSHKRTLLVAPTGQGKSLCYALPAALMDGICLVVSPLISLMQDQLRQLPPKIPAATLSGSITTAQMALIVDDIMRGRYKVLFVSPERLASAAFRRLVRPKFNVETRQYERQFPTVSLLCVDEAHCLSQWGHNFRPSYLRVKSLLPLIEPKSILALTATAGPMVVKDICNTLCIPFDGRCFGDERVMPSPITESHESNSSDKSEGVKVLNCDRDNIDVFSFVLQSNDERRYLLHKILIEKNGDNERSKKLPIEEGCLSKGSVIVYVWRQKDTEIVAEQLNGAGISGGVVCYHGGMDYNARSKAQSKFLRGKARICVATVAFGLGINKPDIVGVIHLCMPPSPEHYQQEIGRAGRDGRAAKAIALPLVDEFVKRHSLAHSDRLSRNQLEIVFFALQKLVNEALDDIPPEAGVDWNASEIFLDDIHVAMPVIQTVDASDCKEESIETILSLLEEESSSNQSLLSVEGSLPDAATITLKRKSLDKLEKIEPLARSILKCGIRVDGQSEQSNDGSADPYSKYQTYGGTAMQKGFYAYSFGTYKFSVVRCARCMGPNTEPRHVYAALRRLQGNGELELNLDTTSSGRALHLKMKQEGINLFRKRGTTNSDVDDLEEASLNQNVQAIVTRLSKQGVEKEKVSVGKVQSMYEILHQVSSKHDHPNEKEEEDESLLCEEEDYQLSEYEQARARNIEKNNGRLRSLGLISLAEEKQSNDMAWGRQTLNTNDGTDEEDGDEGSSSDEEYGDVGSSSDEGYTEGTKKSSKKKKKKKRSSSALPPRQKKSQRLIVFQKLVQHYFHDGIIDDIPSVSDSDKKAPTLINDFPLQNNRLLSCLSSDISQLMQLLAIRKQEQMPGTAVRIRDATNADYRDLCLAKILHAIDAPRAPILGWYSHPLWGKYRSYSFSSVVAAVKKTFEYE